MDIIHYPLHSPTCKDDIRTMLALAERLGHRSIILLDCPSIMFMQLQQATTMQLFAGSFIESSELGRIKKNNMHFSGADKGCVEHPNIRGILEVERLEKKDKLHQRSSGLNMVIARLAAAHQKVLLLSLAQLNTQKKQQILGRFMQNARIARKAKLPTIVVSGARTPYELKSPKELCAAGAYLNIPTQLMKQAEHLLRIA